MNSKGQPQQEPARLTRADLEHWKKNGHDDGPGNVRWASAEALRLMDERDAALADAAHWHEASNTWERLYAQERAHTLGYDTQERQAGAHVHERGRQFRAYIGTGNFTSGMTLIDWQCKTCEIRESQAWWDGWEARGVADAARRQ